MRKLHFVVLRVFVRGSSIVAAKYSCLTLNNGQRGV